MLALYALPVAIAAFASTSAGQGLSAPPTPPPLVSPSPTPSVTASPGPLPSASSSPAPSPAPSPSATPNPFGYIVNPSPPPAGAPRIIEIALNDKVLHPGGMLLVRVTTSPEITALVVRAMGHELGVPLASPGVFSGQQQIPVGSIPSYMLNRTYRVDFVGTTADRRTATASLDVRFER